MESIYSAIFSLLPVLRGSAIRAVKCSLKLFFLLILLCCVLP